MKQLLRAGVSITLLAIAVWMFDWNNLIATAAKVSSAVYGLALALSFLHFLPMFLRWSYLVRGAAPSSLLHHGSIYFYGSFLNTFTPANLGGDIYRVAQLRGLSGSQKVLSVLLRERFIGLIGLEVGFLLFYIAMMSAGGRGVSQQLMQISGAIIAAALIATLLAPWLLKWLPRREGSRMERLLEGLHAATVFPQTRELLLMIFLSLLALALWVAAIDVLARNLCLGMSFAAIGAVTVLTELVRLVPISLQGIGVREGTFAFLAALCGARPDTAFVVATLAYLVLSLSLVVCGGTGWILEQIRQRHEGKA
jgi:uncharacterized protein (TIRG00374 family)